MRTQTCMSWHYTPADNRHGRSVAGQQNATMTLPLEVFKTEIVCTVDVRLGS